GGYAHRSQVARTTRLEQRVAHFRSVGERVDEDVQRLLAEVRHQVVGESLDGEVAGVAVALVLPDVLRCVFEAIVGRVQWIDALASCWLSVRALAGVFQLSACERGADDVGCGWPGGHTHACSRLGERLGNGESEAAVVCDARYQGPAS